MGVSEIWQQAPRRRHRTTQRKLIDAILLVLGVPLLLFSVLALSVELIEYRPDVQPPESSEAVVVEPAAVMAEAGPDRAARALDAFESRQPIEVDPEAWSAESIDLD